MRRALPLAVLSIASAFSIAPALAGDLPTFAQTGAPTPAADPASFWKGLSYGVEGYAVGGKGVRGGVGGGANVAWTKSFDNNLFVQLKTTAGYMPGVVKASPWGRSGFSGAHFAQAEATVGYEMGRVRPWVSVGGGALKASRDGGFANGLASANSLFSEPGKTRGFMTYGAGVDYAVTNKLTIGVAVHGVRQQ